MIELYVVRHGQAQDEAVGGDAMRALTAKARKRLHKTARNLADRSGGIDLILTSPLVRAVQTAEILAGSCKPDAVEVLPELAPPHAPEAALAAVSKRAKGAGAIALVGHEPLLSRLIAALAEGVSPGKLEIRAGSVVRVDVDRLPKPRKAIARWWLKSGRHKGLPLKEEPKEAAPKKARAARPAAPAVAKKRPPRKRPAPRPKPLEASEPKPPEASEPEPVAPAAEPPGLTPS
ncbi:MAG TPA: phosphohistidine phosphatase SixA [Myxococcales bacterium]|nr:phosphohistidine phosphatase SixA [Myxococcales bacterium]